MDILSLAEKWLGDLDRASSPEEIKQTALKTIAAALVVIAKESQLPRRNVSINNNRNKT